MTGGAGLPVSRAGSSDGHRLDALTGVRILAALVVWFGHVEAPAGAPEALLTFRASGYMGVTLFFVLSGFVLALNYFDRLRHSRPRVLWNYFVARFARVYPLYLVVLLAAMLIYRVEGEPIGPWLAHVVGVQAWDPDLRDAFHLNAPAWSVSVELFLYACLPLLVVPLTRLTTTRQLLVASVLVAVAMLAVATWFELTGRADLPREDPDGAHRLLYRTPLLRIGDFLLGILAARLYLTLRDRPDVARRGSALAVLSAVVIVALMTWPAHLFSAWSWDASYAIASAVLLFGLAVAPRGLPARMLGVRGTVLLGEASYAFYLIHLLALDRVQSGLWRFGLTPVTVAYEAMVLGALLALAMGLHVGIERPARRWLRRNLEFEGRAPSSRSRPDTAPARTG